MIEIYWVFNHVIFFIVVCVMRHDSGFLQHNFLNFWGMKWFIGIKFILKPPPQTSLDCTSSDKNIDDLDTVKLWAD